MRAKECFKKHLEGYNPSNISLSLLVLLVLPYDPPTLPSLVQERHGEVKPLYMGSPATREKVYTREGAGSRAS